MTKKTEQLSLDDQCKLKLLNLIVDKTTSVEQIESLTRSFLNLIQAENSNILRYLAVEEFEHAKKNIGIQALIGK